MAEGQGRRAAAPWIYLAAGAALFVVGAVRWGSDTARSPWASLVAGGVLVVLGLVAAVRRRSLR